MVILNNNLLSILSVFLPLIGFLCAAFSAKSRFSKIVAQFVTVLCMGVATVVTCILFYQVVFNSAVVHFKIAEWIDIGAIKVNWAIYIDILTVIMLMVVNTVSLVVHIYSIGYMSHDKGIARFMSFLSLFTFFMLFLVCADNFLQLFVGWEGVGLCSYLLIGFWFEKSSACAASLKAFFVNRIGDIGLLCGIILIAVNFGSLEFTDVFAVAKSMTDVKLSIFGFEVTLVSCICFSLFFGCMGKSAQLGLHVWLPDAMEGPTPVSALIHAATMVTAGVFLLARCSYLFELAPSVLNIITIVGAVTCLFAATVAMVQDDIKKIIAYSTCSQLGYMFFACGLSMYNAGVFHLLTHAFFKALLFLGAGNIIHSLSGQQNITKMGDMRSRFPYTFIFMLIGAVAIAGVPPFAGFYSKDLILEGAYESNRYFAQYAYWIGVISAFLTSLYSFRLIFLVFYGKRNDDNEVIHESPYIMLIPLFVLSAGAALLGFLGDELSISLADFWNGSIFFSEISPDSAGHSIGFFRYIPIIVSIVSIFTAYMVYLRFTEISRLISRYFSFIKLVLIKKYFFDEIYNFIFVMPIKTLSSALGRYFDRYVIDGIPSMCVRVVTIVSKVASLMQTGYVYHYAMAMMIGVMVLIYWYLP